MISNYIGYHWFVIFLIILTGCNQRPQALPQGFITNWQVKSSLKYDVCNMIGILTGRKLYQKFYPRIYSAWSKKLPPKVKFSLSKIDKLVGKDWPPGPRLSMLMSAVPADNNLSVILQAMENSDEIHERLIASDFGSQKNWQQWVSLKPHLKIVIGYLKIRQFDLFWRSKLLPKMTTKIPEIEAELQAYDVIGDLSRFLVDHPITSDTITVYLSALGQPHELRLGSQTRVTAFNNPLKATVQSFYNEVLHTYCDSLVDSLFVDEFISLKEADCLIKSHRKISPIGNNGDLTAYFRKNLVLAGGLWVGQKRRLISSRQNAHFSNSDDAIRRYLSSLDNGGHMLAAVIFSYLDAGLKLDRISYKDFIGDLFNSGRLHPQKVEQRYHKFMNTLTAEKSVKDEEFPDL